MYPFTITNYVPNPAVMTGADYPAACAAIMSSIQIAEAVSDIRHWPGYERTPLVELKALADEIDVARIAYKDESGRFGLGSFKALGGAYAVYRLLAKLIAGQVVGACPVTVSDLLSGKYRDIVSTITVASATDGNHGRSVAWGARMFGCNCTIFLHEKVSAGRQAAIEAYGATIVRTPGNYDDSVRAAADTAAANGWHVVSDTSYDGYTEIPANVMLGYTAMTAEIFAQNDGQPPFTHVFVQGGVGGLAAAVLAHFWARFGAERPKFIVVEPDQAACLLGSALAGSPITVHGELDTMMAGLACGEPSPIAWDFLGRGADHFIALPDNVVAPMMRRLAAGEGGDPCIVAGESAVAGLAGAIAARADASLNAALGLDENSRILVIGTEGATDPELYQRLVGDLEKGVTT